MTESIECVLQRVSEGDEGTFGVFTVPLFGFQCLTVELPDRENEPMRSRVPAGIYAVEWSFSNRFQRYRYRILDVPGQAGILIHPANFGGDTLKGWKSDLSGCIGLGERKGFLNPSGKREQAGITNSIKTVENFELMLIPKPLSLTIIDKVIASEPPPTCDEP